MRNSIKTILKWKNKKKIVMLSLYEAYFAKICEKEKIDIILIGDSVGNVLYGYENTLPVSMEMMIRHTQAIERVTQTPMIITDMPFLSYQVSLEEAIKAAGKIFKETQAQAVKIEGCCKFNLQLIRRLIEIGIPVMGHLGLTPQSINLFGNYAKQAKDPKDAQKLKSDAVQLEKAGCFSIVLENIPENLAREITRELNLITIGIGAGPDTDGQVLVLHDILGIDTFQPKFVKKYANLNPVIAKAIREYKQDIENNTF